MSWDVLLFVLDNAPPRASDLPSDWIPPTFETALIRRAVSAEFPATDWADPSRGLLIGENWSVEFIMGAEPVASTVSLNLRGEEGAFAVIERLRSFPNWYMMDVGSGEWLHHMDPPDAGFSDFRAFRDRAIAAHPPPPPGSGVVGRLRRLLGL